MRGIMKKLAIYTITVTIVLSVGPPHANAAQDPFLNGIVSIAGNNALDDKGKLWSWNDETYEAVPILEDVKTISEGNAAIKMDGSVWTWGRKVGNIELPDGGYYYYNSFDPPSRVEGLDNAIDISGNYVLKADGTVWSLEGLCEYQTANDACAPDASVEEKRKPGRIGELENIIAIEGRGYFPVALAKDGTVWFWGRDKYNDPFLPGKLYRSGIEPTDFKNAASISTGMLFSASWDVYIINRYAVYGLTTPNFNVAKLAPGVTAVSGAMDDLGDFYAFSFVLMKDGTVSYWIWPTEDKKLYPVKGIGQAITVSAKGEAGGTVLHKDGTVSSWGKMSNFYGDDKYKYDHKIIPKKVVKGIGIRLNGNYVLMENQSRMINGSVFVPIRGLFESLGGSVNYANNIVTIKYGSNIIKMEVGKKEATINGTSLKLPSPVQIVKGRTMVPLRFVSQAMGAKVVWDGKNREVLLTL